MSGRKEKAASADHGHYGSVSWELEKTTPRNCSLEVESCGCGPSASSSAELPWDILTARRRVGWAEVLR